MGSRTRPSSRTTWFVAAALVWTAVALVLNLSDDDRGVLGTIGLVLQVIGVVGMVVGLVLVALERRRDGRRRSDRRAR